MINKLLSYLSPIIQVLTLVLVVVILFSGNQSLLRGTTNYDALDTTDGYSVDGTTVINGSGQLAVAGGTTITEHGCATATWNPDSFSSSTIASTTITLTGFALGDILDASFNSPTSTDQWFSEANSSTTAGSAVVYLVAVPGTTAWNSGLNLTTSTARVCYWAH